MKKKVISLVLGFCMAAGVISGCGAEDTMSAEGNTSASSSEEVSENSAASVQEEITPEFYLAKYSRYVHTNSDEFGESTWRETKEYDVDGNVTREGNFSEDLLGYRGSDLQYDAGGNLIRMDMYGIVDEEENAEPVITGWYDYEYDADGNRIREMFYSFYEEAYGEDWTVSYIYHEDGIPSELLEYDSDGHVLKRIRYNGKGQAAERTESTYDEKGNQIIWAVYIHEVYDEAQGSMVYDEEGVLDYRDEMEYNAAGNEVKTTRYGSDGEILYVTEKEYDAAGNLLSDICTYKDDGTVEKSEYAYDAAGNCILEKYSFGAMTEFEYDANGNRIKSTYYDESGKGSVQFEAEYDANGNEMKRTDYQYDWDGSVTATEYTESSYDAAGNLLEMKRTGGWEDYWYRYEYDEKGNAVKITELDQEGDILMETSYAYNAEGVQTKYVTVDGTGNVLQSEEYDEQGFLLQKTVDGVELNVAEEHDEAGNLTKRTFSDSTGVVEEYEFTYAEK